MKNTYEAYFSHDYMEMEHISQGLIKSALYSIEIAIIGVVNGAGVKGGAEGVGRATTRSVVQAISAIIVTAMVVVIISTV